MSTFVMLCGLPASGKSTLAKELSIKYDAEILSSDDIREELLDDINNQERNSEVFEVMNKRTKELLGNGINVIYDATNINRKRRIHLINHEIKADKKVIYYLYSELSLLKLKDKCRDRTVGDEVIDRMYKNMHVPTKNEGWDEVIFHHEKGNYYASKFKQYYENVITDDIDHDELFQTLLSTIYDFKDIINIPQDSSYHSFSISRHTYYVYKYILDNYNEEDKLMMLWAALFHDIGKGFCKSFVNYRGETQRYANFIGHEYASAQIAIYWLHVLGYEDQFIKVVADLIQFHMMPMKASEKKMNEVKNLLGDTLYEKLLILHEADMQAK